MYLHSDGMFWMYSHLARSYLQIGEYYSARTTLESSPLHPLSSNGDKYTSAHILISETMLACKTGQYKQAVKIADSGLDLKLQDELRGEQRRTVYIKTGDVGMLDFEMNWEQKNGLIQSGWDAVHDALGDTANQGVAPAFSVLLPQSPSAAAGKSAEQDTNSFHRLSFVINRTFI